MQCRLCPLACGADRSKRAGACGVTGISVAKSYLHPYEEPPICHTNGSGAVFFTGCSLRCVFCQNYELSHATRGKPLTARELCDVFADLEARGADVLDLVTPDHIADRLAEALRMYRPHIPVVYNSSGYCSLSALELLDPYIDVYLPDFKFLSPDLSARYTRRSDYGEIASRALTFMAKKPVLREGVKLLSGLMVRHLVLPGCTSDSLRVLGRVWEIAGDVPLSVMRQYTPAGDIAAFPELQRRVTAREYRRVVDHALALGFTEIYTQDKASADLAFVPKWDD